MAIYEERAKELRGAIAASGTSSEVEKKVLLAAVDKWDRDRRQHLSAFHLFIRGNICASASAEWKRSAAALRSDLALFEAVLKNVANPSEWASNFINVNSAAEGKFVTAIEGACITADARDYMMKYLEALQQVIKSLEVKWSQLMANHASYKQQEEDVLEQLYTLIAAACAQAEDDYKRMAGGVANWVVGAKKALEARPDGGSDTIPIPYDNEVTLAGTGVERWRVLTVGVETQRLRFERYFHEEIGSVLFLFADFRKDTQRFVDEWGYQKVLDQETAAWKALDMIVSSVGTSSGNKADAEYFVEGARLLIKEHVTSAKNAWDDFVMKHEKKFFGPVGPDISRALLDRDTLEKKYERLQAANLHQLAMKWRDGAREVWNVDFSGIPPHLAEIYRNALRDKLRDLDDLLREPLLKRLKEGFDRVVDMALINIKR